MGKQDGKGPGKDEVLESFEVVATHPLIYLIPFIWCCRAKSTGGLFAATAKSDLSTTCLVVCNETGGKLGRPWKLF